MVGETIKLPILKNTGWHSFLLLVVVDETITDTRHLVLLLQKYQWASWSAIDNNSRGNLDPLVVHETMINPSWLLRTTVHGNTMIIWVPTLASKRYLHFRTEWYILYVRTRYHIPGIVYMHTLLTSMHRFQETLKAVTVRVIADSNSAHASPKLCTPDSREQ